MVGAGGGRWSVFCIFADRRSVFIFENGLNQYLVGCRWLMVCGRWLVGGSVPSRQLFQTQQNKNVKFFECMYGVSKKKVYAFNEP